MAVARALYPFEGSQEGDLSFNEDDVIRVLRQDDSGWWEGQTDDGRRGEFPFNYVELISPEELANFREASRQVTEGRYQRNVQQQGDSVNKVKVYPVPKSANFTVEVTLARKKVQATKAMNDFRELDETIRYIYPNFDRPLPPMWADKVYISEEASRKKSRVLEMFVKKCMNQAVLEYTLVSWVNQRESFQTTPDVVQMVRNAVQNGARNGNHRNSFNVALLNVCPLAKVGYERLADDAVELSLYVGDIIAIRNQNTTSKGWWEGETSDGTRGLFPSNHVRVLGEEEARTVVTGDKPRKNTGLKPQASSTNLMRRNNTQKPAPAAPTPVQNVGGASGGKRRDRKTEENFAMPSLDAFDELLIEGFTMIQNGKVFTPKQNANCPCEGDTVTLSYTAYVWDCQKQRIIEFASSDLPDNRNYVGPLKFVVGKGDTIKALERAVQYLEIGQESRIIVRPDLGYGDIGNPPSVPPNCHLVYDVRLEAFDGAILPGPPPPAGVMVSSRSVNEGARPKPSAPAPVAQVAPFSPAPSPYRPAGAVPTPLTATSPQSLVDAIARRTQNVPPADVYSSQAPIGERPKRQPPAARKQPKQKKNSPRNAPTATPPAPVNTQKYDLPTMKNIVMEKDYKKYGIDPVFLEDQLTDEGFQDAFGCDRAAFLLMPRWKQNKMKKDAGLY